MRQHLVHVSVMNAATGGGGAGGVGSNDDEGEHREEGEEGNGEGEETGSTFQNRVKRGRMKGKGERGKTQEKYLMHSHTMGDKTNKG